MPFDLKDLGLNIKNLRLARSSAHKPGRSLLQRELAERAGIPASSLCNIENGKYRNPTWEILTKISQGLECEISELFLVSQAEVSPSQIALTELIETIIRERLDFLLQEQPKK
jgi:transcriptional regulator with XRE-family HTH domain